MRNSRGAVFVDQGTGGEAREIERRIEFVRMIVCDRVRKDPSGPGRCLEAARSPAAIEVEARQRHFADYRAGVRTDINDTAPLTQHAHAAEPRE